jgi:peptidase C39-like protein
MAPVSLSTQILNVPVHLQDDPDACAKACAEMVLLFLTGTLFQQTQLSPPTQNPPWAVSPDQLRDLINNAVQPTPFVRYRVFAEATRNNALDRVWRALDNGFPAVTLSAQDHWIVVHGITDGTPAIAHIRNPLPDREDVLALPLPLHSTSDLCAALDLVNSGQPDGEVASVCTKYCIQKANHLPLSDPFHGLYVVVAPDLPKNGATTDFRCSGKTPHPAIANVAFHQLQETNVLEQPGWSDFVARPRIHDDVFVNVAGLTDAADSFTIVKLTNEAGSVILVSLTMDGEFIAAMLEPSKRLIETQFATFSPVALGLPPVCQVRAVSSFSPQLFFSPFVFALEVNEPGAPTYFVRPYDGKRFDSLESPPTARQRQQ